MILQHPHTSRRIEVADGQADEWREAGWIDPTDAADEGTQGDASDVAPELPAEGGTEGGTEDATEGATEDATEAPAKTRGGRK